MKTKSTLRNSLIFILTAAALIFVAHRFSPLYTIKNYAKTAFPNNVIATKEYTVDYRKITCIDSEFGFEYWIKEEHQQIKGEQEGENTEQSFGWITSNNYIRAYIDYILDQERKIIRKYNNANNIMLEIHNTGYEQDVIATITVYNEYDIRDAIEAGEDIASAFRKYNERGYFTDKVIHIKYNDTYNKNGELIPGESIGNVSITNAKFTED